jgi:uncharacterized membrane protein HdeD (DUF308 family)
MKRKVRCIMDFPTTISPGPLDSITGILLIILGVLSLVFPVLAFSLIVLFFAIFAVIVSFGLIRSGMSDPGEMSIYRTLKVLAGLLGFLLALSFLVAPYVVSVAAKDLFGFWAVLTGVAAILSIFTGEPGMERALNAISGVVLAATGLLILIAPAVITDYLLVIILAFFAIITGVFSLWSGRTKTPDENQINHAIYK